MAKKMTTGTGSTQRTRLFHSTTDPDDVTSLQQAMAAWAAAGDSFAAKLQRIETFCQSILSAKSISYDPAGNNPRPRVGEPDSSEGYALRILDNLHSLRRFLERGEARNAADLAFDLGALLSEASMKPLADRGFSQFTAQEKRTNSLQQKHEEIRKAFSRLLEGGAIRKNAIKDLCEKFNLKTRQIENILAKAGGK